MAKYIREASNDVQNRSHVWQSVENALQTVITKGYHWRLGNGGYIQFWKDSWATDSPFCSSFSGPIPAGQENDFVKEYWRADGSWDWARIGDVVSNFIRPHLGAVAVDDDERNVPDRIRAFMWMLAKGCIFTNQERRRRHLTQDDSCSLYDVETESCDHLFWDCTQVIRNWHSLGIPSRHAGSFKGGFVAWFRENIMSTQRVNGVVQCSAIFATATWWPWKWRDDFVFNGVKLGGIVANFILNKVKEYSEAWNKRHVFKLGVKLGGIVANF
ncbi:hypothetical protein V2J09_012855 [Rumex salicifolius]